MSRLIAIVPLLLLAGCTNQGDNGFPGVGLDPNLELYEPVIRHIVPRAANDGAKVVYVGFADGKVPPSFLDRFRNEAIPVKSESEPREKGVKSHHIVIGSVQLDNPDRPRVFVNDYDADEMERCGTPYPIPLKKSGGKWVIDQGPNR